MFVGVCTWVCGKGRSGRCKAAIQFNRSGHRRPFPTDRHTHPHPHPTTHKQQQRTYLPQRLRRPGARQAAVLVIARRAALAAGVALPATGPRHGGRQHPQDLGRVHDRVNGGVADAQRRRRRWGGLDGWGWRLVAPGVGVGVGNGSWLRGRRRQQRRASRDGGNCCVRRRSSWLSFLPFLWLAGWQRRCDGALDDGPRGLQLLPGLAVAAAEVSRRQTASTGACL